MLLFKILTANFDIDLSIFIMSLFSTSSFIHTIGHSFGFAYNSLRCYTEMYGMRSTRKPSLALHPVFSLAKTAALFLWSWIRGSISLLQTRQGLKSTAFGYYNSLCGFWIYIFGAIVPLGAFIQAAPQGSGGAMFDEFTAALASTNTFLKNLIFSQPEVILALERRCK